MYIHYLDDDFGEYVILKDMADLPLKCKVKLTPREPTISAVRSPSMPLHA